MKTPIFLGLLVLIQLACNSTQQIINEFDKENYQSVIDLASIEIDKKIDDPNVLLLRGLAYSRLENCEKAIQDFEVLNKEVMNGDVVLASKGPMFYAQYGHCAFQMGNTLFAKSLFLKVLELDNNYPLLHYNLSICYFHEDSFDLALYQMLLECEDNPSFAIEKHEYLVQLYLKNGLLEKARNIALNAYSTAPKKCDNLVALGDVYEVLKDYPNSKKFHLALFQADCNKDQKRVAEERLSYAYYALDELDSSLMLVNELLSNYRNDDRHYYMKFLVLKKLGQLDSACVYLGEANRLSNGGYPFSDCP